MSFIKQQSMNLFLKRNYYTLSEIAKVCRMSESDILILEKAQCIPGHTYELREINILSCAGIDSPLSENESIVTTYFYHRSIKDWVLDARQKTENIDLHIFASTVKDTFAKKLDEALGGIKTPGCRSFEQAWRYWIDGTWGKCLKEISTNCLAQKELARYHIAEFMKKDPNEINKTATTQLQAAVENYISASLDFDPYGMRHILADEAISKFTLNIEYNREYLLK